MLLCFNNYGTSEQKDGDTDGANKAKRISYTEDKKKDWDRPKNRDRPEDRDGHNNMNMKDFISMLDTQ